MWRVWFSRKEGKRLVKCLIKMTLGKTTNGIAHLKMYKKLLEVQGKAESEATKRKMKGNDEDQGGGKKIKSTQLGRFFPTNITSQNIKKSKQISRRN